MKKLTLTVAILLTFALSALAVDYWGGPPPGTWNRGDHQTTYQHWTFEDPGLVGPPNDVFNPYGEPMLDFEGMFEWGQYECPPELDPDGVVEGWHCIEPEGGRIILTIPNTEALDGAKLIFMQITSSKAPSNVSATGHGSNPGGYTSSTWPTGLAQIQWPSTPPAPYGGAWYTYNYGLKIEPNPQSETITIEVPYCTVIDQIVVDTICTGTIANDDATWGEVKALFE